ncbi:dihydroxyacetone kinase subunit DhaL [Bacillus taeanensis]|uniref:phosphoenolpyruvate--glycerone phosphotransferase n=1 Tax=Bacillus taeanensis TaxID=273032 RepID=A0A366XRN6_9BACI|nr:dihydroxyacetone kinase subunit DhaL [Bacillus taeanensis]RBW68198.1 dihydroxyacetone kinase subunit L [Bacillus taeanensis]
MKTVLTIDDIKNILSKISEIMDENKDYLCKLDGALGDGDIGLTMSKGFKAIKNHLPNVPEEDIGVLLMQSGLEMANAAASTMGTLVATALMRSGKISQGKTELTLEDLSTAVKAMVDGIRERGKAEVGDKTILDSLHPAYAAIENANKNGSSLEEAITEAYKAAEEGMTNTKQMQSQHGRAGRYLEKSIGHQDPGATVGALFFRGFSDYINTLVK